MHLGLWKPGQEEWWGPELVPTVAWGRWSDGGEGGGERAQTEVTCEETGLERAS